MTVSIDARNRKTIVWLASYPRSGNTWIRVFLANLRRVVGGEDGAVDLNKIGGIWDGRFSLYARYLPDPLPKVIPDEMIARIRPTVLRDLAVSGPPPVLIKTHNIRGENLGTHFIDKSVTAGAIYVVRNPLDVAISWAAFRGRPLDSAIADMAFKNFRKITGGPTVYWMQGDWSQNVRTWTDSPDEATLVVRYEDLIDQPSEWFTKVAAHVGMTASADQIAEAISRSSFENSRKQESVTGFREKPDTTERFFRVGQSGQWRAVLSSAQINAISGKHRRMMERFGYLP